VLPSSKIQRHRARLDIGQEIGGKGAFAFEIHLGGGSTARAPQIQDAHGAVVLVNQGRVAMHEVLIRGHSLRRIETAMQRSELSLITTLSGKQRTLIAEGQPVVLEVVVTEIDSQEKRTGNASGALPE
jgi:hypothetical protein